ncbi:MAG: hypothetical protein ACE5EL_03580 [Anaerolineae bacterium]
MRARATGQPAASIPTGLALAAAEGFRAAPTKTLLVSLDGAQGHGPVLRRSSMAPGQVIEGPALIGQEDATTYVDRGWQSRVGPMGNLHLVPGGQVQLESD